MINSNIPLYYCCLNIAERTAYIICAANAGSITYFVVKALIDGAFLLAVEGDKSIRQTLFVENNYLTYGTLPPEDPEGIEVYYMEPEYWNSVNAYMDEHGTGCASPCKLRTFPL